MEHNNVPKQPMETVLTYEEWAATARKIVAPLEHEAVEHGFHVIVTHADGSWIGCLYYQYNVIVECHDEVFDDLDEAQRDLWENYAKYKNEV